MNLPAPVQSYAAPAPVTAPNALRGAVAPAGAAAPSGAASAAPAYGSRSGFVPRTAADYGDGGAFPEVHVAQFPRDMGRPNKKPAAASGAIVPVSVDANGNAQFDGILRQGLSKDKKIYSKHTDLVPKTFKDEELMRPSVDEEVETTAKTQNALQKLIEGRIAAARPVQVPGAGQKGGADPKFIRYTADGGASGSGPTQRVIRMVEAQVDPMEPPSFKHTKAVRGPPSPPVPVMHSPPRKVTVQDQQDWKIPPCVSNWKNSRGYTIPLDKRLATDGRGLQEVTINDKFAEFSEAMYIAEGKAREAIKYRASVRSKLSAHEKEQQEAELRKLAAEARAGTSHQGGGGRGGGGEEVGDGWDRPGASDEDGDATAAAGGGGGDEGGGGGGGAPRDAFDDALDEEERTAKAQRERMRNERKREREREMRLENAGKKSKMARDQDRDVSEKVALGLHTGGGKLEGESQFDSRLFNQSAGMSSGFGDESEYNVYSKGMFERGETKMYAARNDPAAAQGSADDQYNDLKNTERFKPARDFQGVDRSAPKGQPRSEPVQFERQAAAAPAADAVADDPFGLDQFLTEAKRGKQAMDRIGEGSGGMSASAGGAGRSAEEYSGGGGRQEVRFTKGSSA